MEAGGVTRFAFALVRTSVKSAVAQRGAFVMRATLMTLNNAIFFTFWIVLFSQVPQVRGYTLGDMAVLYGVVALAHGMAVVFAGGLEHLARLIHEGELDALLAQPKPTLLYALGTRSQPSGVGDIVSGLVMIAFSGRVTIPGIPLVILAGIAGAMVLVATAVLLHSSAFWLGRTDTASRQLYEGTLLFSLYPDTLFGGPMRWIMFSVLPGGFVGFLPATLIKAPSLSVALGVMLAVAVYWMAAVLVFHRGLRSYSSGSRFATFG
jgi:ABC-2 type transport system permease protein